MDDCDRRMVGWTLILIGVFCLCIFITGVTGTWIGIGMLIVLMIGSGVYLLRDALWKRRR